MFWGSDVWNSIVSLEAEFEVRQCLKLGVHRTREAPEGQVSHSLMGMVGSIVPAKPCDNKSGSECGPVGLSIFTT